jgi:surfeit locus 1 family protein
VARARFLLRPRWLLSHLLVALLIVLMVNLGFWQLRRLDEKQDRNALVEARMDRPVTAVDELVGPDAGAAAVDEARFRQVAAVGTYDAGATVVVRNRSQDGRAGGWVVTPLTLSGGERVGVIRGFVPLADDGSTPEPAPPGDRVTVTGLAMDPDRLGGTAGRDVDDLMAEDGMLPVLVQAQSSDPADAGSDAASAAGPGETATPSPAAESAGLVLLPEPELSEGPHLSYAVQWFIFSTIALVGYPIILRRVVAGRGKGPEDEGEGEGDGGGQGGGDDELDRELEELVRKGQ